MPNAIFRVFVNQVDVGAIPEQDYRAIVTNAAEQVKADRLLYRAQAVNVAYCAFVVVATALKFVPIFIFLLSVGGVLAAPDLVTEQIAQLQAATPAQITQALRLMLVWIGVLSVISLPVTGMIMGYNFGFVNKFKSARSERISLRIRALLEVPAEGDVTVHVAPGFRL